MGASAAVAILFKREKELVAHFRSHGATDSAHAMTPLALGVEQRLAWEILQRNAIIRDGAPGTFYLDELSWEASRRRRRRVALIMLVIVLAAALIAFMGTTTAAIYKAGQAAGAH